MPAAATDHRSFDLDRLSRTEWEIMRICWRLGTATVHDVLRESLKTATRDYRTILTFLRRMADKGYLDVEKIRNTNHFTPAYPPEVALGHEIRCFLDQVIGPEKEHRRLLRRLLDEAEFEG